MKLQKTVITLLITGVLLVGLRYLLPIALPFLLGGLLALVSEPLVKVFHRRLHLPRWAATGIGVTMTLTLLLLSVMVLVALLLRQLRALADVVPDLEQTAMQGLSFLEQWLMGLISQAPKSLNPVLTHSVQGLFSDSTALLDRLATQLLGLASGVLKGLPDSVLGIFTWLVSGFMLSARLPKLRAWISTKLPPVWKERYFPMLRQIKRSAFGWLKAQFKLIGITFLVLSVGFFLLRISYTPVWAGLIALVDALPVLGIGTVLVPWSVICFLQGDSLRGIGLLGVYAAASLLRSVLEPRLVGKQLGLDPLITLLAIWVGYRLFGLGGMLLAPLFAVIAAQVLAKSQQTPPPEKNS